MKTVASAEPAPATDAPGSDDLYYIEATTSLVDRQLRTLKHNDLFGVFDRNGDLKGGEDGPDGLYFHDTRFLSGLQLRLGGMPPLLLGSVVLDDNGALVVDMTNADLHDRSGRLWLPRDALFAGRFKFLFEDSCYERLVVRRYGVVPRPVPVDLHFAADFADLFEVRGERRARRGSLSAELVSADTVRFSYQGLDDIERRTILRFDPAPSLLTAGSARWDLDLAEAVQARIVVVTRCEIAGRETAPARPMRSAYLAVRRRSRGRLRRLNSVTGSNALFNAVIARSASDIDMLLSDTPYGLYPYAGVPWYSTIFGRDGLLTAMQLLWVAPEIAKGVLKTLALTQATEVDEAADAEPGKIVHEIRGSEMARLGEVPFGCYYGSVDATPLFVMLAGQYLERTGDLETVRAIWPNVEAALAWIEGPADYDGDGFVEYQRMTERGLANQGWKDSFDSVFHADGTLAEGPIALCEIQAYAFAARRSGAAIARCLGLADRAAELDRAADLLRERFEDRFWIEKLGCYALALDGDKQPCRVLSSNAGHALFAGIAAPERAARLARLFMGRRFFSGWGIRTVAAGEACYNPMSYHNGSVWPHDNAVIAMGLARYGHKAAVLRIFRGLFEAATHDELRRLPELFCGFAQRRGRGPTAYPVACSPQAWAAAAPFALVAAAAGVEFDNDEACVRLRSPALPVFLDRLDLAGVEVAGSRLDLRLCRTGDDVTTAVDRREGSAALVILK
jgi:glycogen debranching enzyme